MNIDVRPINNEIYATCLDVKNDFLTWATKGCEILLLIQYPYASDFDLNDSFVQALSQASDSQLSLEDGISVNGVTARIIPDGMTHDYKVPVRPASYALFAAKRDTATKTLYIYKPNNDDNCCSVSTLIEIRVNKYVPKKPIIRIPFKKYDETPKYEVKIPQVFPYDDGSIFYTFSGNEGKTYRYPVVEKMLGKPFIVNDRNGLELQFKTVNSGYQIKIKKTEG